MVLISARPQNLAKFVTDTRGVSRDAKDDISRLRQSWDAFAGAANEFGPRDTGLLADGAGGVLGFQLQRWQRQETLVELVQHGFEASDRLHGWPVVTIGDWRLDWRMKDEARRRGLDLARLMGDPGNIVVPGPLLATPIPHDSGFVEDPVCTATGHFVDTALDLAMPRRLQVLAWPRVYSSRHTVRGGHGRGWGSWASAVCARLADGALAYTGPDGQRLRLARDGDGGWRRTVWLRATARTPEGAGTEGAEPGAAGVAEPDDSAGSGVELVWDRESDHPGEVWAFRPDGTVAEVRSADDGTTTFEHDEGRLVRLTHEGGRWLELRWEDDRIVGLATSDGRTVGYRYDHRGDLVEVERSREPRRYDLDRHGRIVAVVDADEVRLCLNAYDADGRVHRQVSPFGRTTTFAYGDDLVTVVGDTDGGPGSRWEHDRQGRLVGLVDADGHRLTRTFDSHGRLLSTTGFGGATVTRAYDEAGRMTSRRDDRGEERFRHDDHGRVVRHERPDGSWTAYDYSADGGSLPHRAHGPDGWEQAIDSARGVVRSVTDADGVTVTVESDGDGSPVAVTDGLGHTTTLAVHPSGEVAAVTLPDGTTWEVEHDDAGRPTAATLPDGGRTEIRWTPGGRLHEVAGPGGSSTRFRYGTHGAAEEVTDPRGRTIELTHDRLERLVGLATGDGRRWALEHTALGLVAEVCDPAGHTWRIGHDPEGRTTGATDPLGHRRAWSYDAVGDLVREVDAAGGITHHVRDAAGRVVAVVDPEGATTALTRDALGRVARVETPDGGLVVRRYTPAGRLAEERTGEGRGRRLRYDAAGRLVEEVDALGGTTTHERDAVGRVVATTTPDGRTQRLTYDAAGRVTAAEIAGAVWRTAYDHDGRVTAQVDPLGATTRFAYDAVGNLVAATDPLGHTTRYRWDDRGLCEAITDPLGHTTRYRWDDRDLCVAAVDALGQVTTYVYDEAGRPVGVGLPDGRRVEHVLDAAGHLGELRVDGRPVLSQRFDRAGRPTLVVEAYGSGRRHRLDWSPGGRLVRLTSGDDATVWEHDGDGLVVARTGPDGRTTTYGYDGRGHLVEQESKDHGLLRLLRDGVGRVVELDATGLHRELRHDERGRLVAQVDRHGDHGEATDVRFEHDAAGRMVRVVADGRAIRFGYDAAGQLVVAAGDDGASWAFRYDAAGRLSAEDRPDGATRAYRYDAGHRLVAVDGPGGATFDHDALGRRTRRVDATGTTRYGWDVLGRLAVVERDDRRRTLDVDAFGSLVAVDGTPLTWDPNGSVPELQAIDGRGVVAAAGVTLGLVDEDASPPAVTWLTGDWRGSARPTDPWGARLAVAPGSDLGGPGPDIPAGIAADGSPEPGGAGSGSGHDGPAPGFLGELEVDDLVWLRNRAYDPATRQFLSPDPLAGDPGSPVLAHPYHYAGNDPIGHADPLGLAPMSIDAYKQYNKVTTGVQWKHVVFAVEVGLSVALMFTPLGPANAARMFAMAGPRLALSAGTKMAGMAANGSAQTAVWELAGQIGDEELAWKDVRWGTVAKGTLFGGVGTMFGGAVGPRLGANVISPLLTKVIRLPGKPANVVSSLSTSSVLLGTTSAGYETYDLTNLPGSDGQFTPSNVVASTISAIPYTVAGGFVAPVRPVNPVSLVSLVKTVP